MSTIAVKKIKLGDNADTSKNFLIEVPAVADGTLTIKRENGTNVISVGSDGAFTINQASGLPAIKIAASGSVTISNVVTLGNGIAKMSSPIQLPINADLNWIPKVNGLHYGYQAINGPNATQAIYTLEVLMYSDDWVIQRFTAIGAVPSVHVRAWYNGTSWGAWTQI